MLAAAESANWVEVARQEGCGIIELSPEKQAEVAGGWIWVAAAIVGTGVAGFAAGTFFGWLSRQR